MKRFRRVVTGINAEGKAVIVSDGDVEDTLAAGSFVMADAWATQEPLSVGPDCSSRAPLAMAALPLPGGSALRYAVVPPDAVQQREIEEMRNAEAGDFETEQEDPGMHTTDTVDCGFILKGELGLELDDGEITWLQAGDCYVQQGTRHAWRNRGDEAAVIGVVMLGARREG